MVSGLRLLISCSVDAARGWRRLMPVTNPCTPAKTYVMRARPNQELLAGLSWFPLQLSGLPENGRFFIYKLPPRASQLQKTTNSRTPIMSRKDGGGYS
jgi:hypothetical protein